MARLTLSRLPYQKAVVDNGPLFTLLTLVFARQQPTYKDVVLERHRPPAYALANQLKYLDFFASINHVLFTSHVVGELKSRKTLPPAVYREFWLCSMDYLRHKKADEKLLTLLALKEDHLACSLVCSVGPIDAGLVALARNEKCVLLTDDEPLLSCCDGVGNPEIHLVEYLL